MGPTKEFWSWAGVVLLCLAVGGCTLLANAGPKTDACERIIAAVKANRR